MSIEKLDCAKLTGKSMSSGEFHLHGAHEHEVEHQAHSGNSLAQYVAIFTAILSSIAAMVSYHGVSVLNDALLTKNDAVIKQNLASDQWAFYQSKSGKQHLMELASQLVPEKAGQYEQQLQRYRMEKEAIRQQALKLEAESLNESKLSEHLMDNHHQEALSIMFLEIAIALASITALTRKKMVIQFCRCFSCIGYYHCDSNLVIGFDAPGYLVLANQLS